MNINDKLVVQAIKKLQNSIQPSYAHAKWLNRVISLMESYEGASTNSRKAIAFTKLLRVLQAGPTKVKVIKLDTLSNSMLRLAKKCLKPWIADADDFNDDADGSLDYHMTAFCFGDAVDYLKIALLSKTNMKKAAVYALELDTGVRDEIPARVYNKFEKLLYG